MSDTPQPTAVVPASDSTDWLAKVTFADLYAEASKVGDRLFLIRLAKEHLIRKQLFEEAMTFRGMERQILAAIKELEENYGKDPTALANAEDSRNESPS